MVFYDVCLFFFFFFNDTATTEIYTLLYTLSLHDALPVPAERVGDPRDHELPARRLRPPAPRAAVDDGRRGRDARGDAAPRAVRAGIHEGAGGRRAVRAGPPVAPDRGHAARVPAGGEAGVRAQGHQALLPRHDAVEPADPARGARDRVPLQHQGAAAPSRRAG